MTLFCTQTAQTKFVLFLAQKYYVHFFQLLKCQICPLITGDQNSVWFVRPAFAKWISQWFMLQLPQWFMLWSGSQIIPFLQQLLFASIIDMLFSIKMACFILAIPVQHIREGRKCGITSDYWAARLKHRSQIMMSILELSSKNEGAGISTIVPIPLPINAWTHKCLFLFWHTPKGACMHGHVCTHTHTKRTRVVIVFDTNTVSNQGRHVLGWQWYLHVHVCLCAQMDIAVTYTLMGAYSPHLTTHTSLQHMLFWQ